MTLVHALNLFAAMSSIGLSPMTDGVASNYVSEQEAVKAASNIYNPLSIDEDREYMGTIYKTESGFSFTVTAGKKRSNSIQLSLSEADIDDVVAFWHTHGDAQPKNRYFSDTDTLTANKFGKPFYLADYTGYLKVYEPNYSTLSPYSAQRLGLPRRGGYSIGKIVKDATRRSIRIKTKRGSNFS